MDKLLAISTVFFFFIIWGSIILFAMLDKLFGLQYCWDCQKKIKEMTKRIEGTKRGRKDKRKSK